MHNWILVLCTVHCVFFIGSCSIPNLEKPECSDARKKLKQFYSFHLANEMAPTEENLKLRENFLVPELYQKLAARSGTTNDYFTSSDDYPRTFKIAECRLNNLSDADLAVQLYWRDDTATVQRSVRVNTVKRGGDWLINSVSPSLP